MEKLTQPVKGKLISAPKGIISQWFGPATGHLQPFYESLGLDGHDGVDFYGQRGTPIYAAHSGTVISAYETKSTAGNYIRLDGKGFHTKYLHLDRILVKKGDKIKQGEQIGEMGNSGSSSSFYMGIHLHFGYYHHKTDYNNGYKGATDPLPLIKNMKYVICNKEQFLIDEDLKLALNIADIEELNRLRTQGLTGLPESIDNLEGYMVYPLIAQHRLKDLFGLK